MAHIVNHASIIVFIFIPVESTGVSLIGGRFIHLSSPMAILTGRFVLCRCMSDHSIIGLHCVTIQLIAK